MHAANPFDLSYAATFRPTACDGCARKFEDDERVCVVEVQPQGADFSVNCVTCGRCADDFDTVGPRALAVAAQRSESFAKFAARAAN